MKIQLNYADQLKEVNGTLCIKDKPIEVKPGWYAIPGFSKYAINKKFEVINLERDRVISVHRPYGNYPMVTVQRDGKEGATRVDLHRLVALAFMPIPDVDHGEEMQVDHVNGDRTDLRLDNLEWVSKTENYRRGRALNKKQDVKAFHVYIKRYRSTAVYDTIDDVHEVTGLSRELLQNLHDAENSYNDSEYVINIVSTSVTVAHKNPVFVEDGTDGTGFIVRSVQEASTITGVPRTSISESITTKSSQPDYPYIRGYRFYRVDERPEKCRRMTLGEALVARYIRLFDNKDKSQTLGYVLIDHKRNIILGHRSRNILVSLIDSGLFDRRNAYIYQVYKRFGTSDLSPLYESAIANFNGRAIEWNELDELE